MKKFIFIFSILLLFTNTQANDNYIIGQKGYIKIMPVFQQWSIESNYEISEVSFPTMIYYPVNRALSLSIRGNQASIIHVYDNNLPIVGGEKNALSGLTDAQLSASYHLENANLVFNLGLNLPSGKKELTANEFSTSSQIAYSYFNFQVPGFGQGLNVSPGISWAAPVSDNLVLGLGATYQLKGGFKPLEDMTDNYDPGDEILITGGFDIKLAPTTTFAVDVIYTTYGEDKMGSQTVFGSGDKIMVSGMLRSYQKFNELFLLVRYRSKGKNSYSILGDFQEEPEKTTPTQLEGIGYYKMRISEKFYLSILGEGRSFYATKNFPNNFPGLDIIGFGLSPEFSPSRNIKIPLRFKYFFGDFTGGTSISGIEAGVGVVFLF